MTPYKQKTTHEMARELLALPDVPLVIELWCDMEGCECVAELTGYDDQTAIIYQKLVCDKTREELSKLYQENFTTSHHLHNVGVNATTK